MQQQTLRPGRYTPIRPKMATVFEAHGGERLRKSVRLGEPVIPETGYANRIEISDVGAYRVT